MYTTLYLSVLFILATQNRAYSLKRVTMTHVERKNTTILRGVILVCEPSMNIQTDTESRCLLYLICSRYNY